MNGVDLSYRMWWGGITRQSERNISHRLMLRKVLVAVLVYKKTDKIRSSKCLTYHKTVVMVNV